MRLPRYCCSCLGIQSKIYNPKFEDSLYRPLSAGSNSASSGEVEQQPGELAWVVAGDVVFFEQVGQDGLNPQSPDGLQVVLHRRRALRGITPEHGAR